MTVRDHSIGLSLFVVLAVVLGFMRATSRPSLTRNWKPMYAVLGTVNLYGDDDVFIQNIRNTNYEPPVWASPTYSDASVRLSDLHDAWLMVEDLGGGQAQFLVDFAFPSAGHVVFAAEPRLEKGETYSALKGLFRRYELAYTVATEVDQVRLRVLMNGHRVYLYRFDLPQEKLRALFLSIAQRANELAKKPEFYHTLFHNSSGELVKHLKPLTGGHLSAPLRPKDLPEVLYDEKILRHDQEFELLKIHGQVTDHVRKWPGSPDFTTYLHSKADGINEGL